MIRNPFTRKSTVDDVVADFNTAIDKLHSLSEDHADKADEYDRLAEDNKTTANFHKNESARAVKIANNIENIVKV